MSTIADEEIALAWPVRVVRLSADPSENGLWCGKEGLTLNHHPLLQMTHTGFQPKPLPELQKIFDGAFGTQNRQDARDYMQGLASVARSLSKGDLPLAMIGSVMLKLPDIAPATVTSKFDQDQPRDEDGRWTEGAGAEAKQPPPIGVEGERSPSITEFEAESTTSVEGESLGAIAPRVIGLLGRFAGILSGPIALAAGLLIPTNRSNIHYGDIPDFPGLTFRSDEGVVTLSRRDADGNVENLYHGLPDADGFYHDEQGDIIGRHVGSGVLFDSDALAEMAGKKDEQSEVNQAERPVSDMNTQQEDDEPKVCPPPTPEDIAGRSARSLAYQSQITGLPVGWDVLFRGVRYDGCNQITQFMQEAKGIMGGYLIRLSDDQLRKTKFYRKTMKQADRQNEMAESRGVDWYFAENRFANFFEKEFKDAGYSNITVHQKEAIMKKIEDCLAFIKYQLNKIRHVLLKATAFKHGKSYWLEG